MPPEDENNSGNLAGATTLALTTYAPTIWGSANYAQDWFKDACAETEAGLGADFRRREIICSVCFLESYLFEWVRGPDIGSVGNYFPTDSQNPKYNRGIKQKWKEIPTELFDDGLISAKPSLDLSLFGQLIRARNGQFTLKPAGLTISMFHSQRCLILTAPRLKRWTLAGRSPFPLISCSSFMKAAIPSCRII